jgi:hypothetical protein
MKNSMLFFLFFTPFLCLAQLSETFTDGNFTQNPVWTGTASNFIVNSENQLQSVAAIASASYLFTPSQAIENATWECKLRIDYPTSSSNYSCIYIVSDKQFIENGFCGYFVQVGGTNDEVSLYYQEGTQKIKIIDGVDKRTDIKPLIISIKVTRDSAAVFNLFSRLSTESDFVHEGSTQNNKVLKCNYFGLSYNNTSSTGNCYFFDDIEVTGTKLTDRFPPEWLSLEIKYPDTLQCVFSEAMNYDKIDLKIDLLPVTIVSQNIHQEMTEINLITEIPFEKGKVYQITLDGLFDLSGNAMIDNKKIHAFTEEMFPGDVVFNEVMFHQPDSSYEYIEFYNRSEKLIELSGFIFTTRKADGSLNTGNKIPDGVLIFPQTCVAFTSNATEIDSIMLVLKRQ